MASGFSIYVAKENLKFSAAHFIAYPGFREPLHGHNYQVGVRVEGRLSPTGYVLDFGLIKRLTKEIVDRLDERTLVPAESDCLQIEHLDNGQLKICYGADEFRLPASDACILPIAHSSAEELARFIWKRALRGVKRPAGAPRDNVNRNLGGRRARTGCDLPCRGRRTLIFWLSSVTR